MVHKKLFIPGPIEVHPDILKAMSIPLISHRAKDFSNLYFGIKDKLRKLFYGAKGEIFIITSSATGAMEGAIRNVVGKRVLSTACGEFGDRWYRIATSNGKEADLLEVELGKAIKPEMVREKLKTGKYDAMTLVHNETSTGVMNPIEDIAKVVKEFPDVMFLVDAVSSLASVKIEPEKLGIDIILAGVQKGFGLPPGIAVAYVSERAMRKAEKVKNRGAYFDFLELKKYDEKGQTPTTPSISHMYALDLQLTRFFEIGLENVFARTLDMAKYCRNWAVSRGFALFPEKGYESVTLTCVSNTKGIDVQNLNAELGKRGAIISDGYGKLKGKTFRIAHMGDIPMDDLKQLLKWIDEITG